MVLDGSLVWALPEEGVTRLEVEEIPEHITALSFDCPSPEALGFSNVNGRLTPPPDGRVTDATERWETDWNGLEFSSWRVASEPSPLPFELVPRTPCLELEGESIGYDVGSGIPHFVSSWDDNVLVSHGYRLVLIRDRAASDVALSTGTPARSGLVTDHEALWLHSEGRLLRAELEPFPTVVERLQLASTNPDRVECENARAALAGVPVGDPRWFAVAEATGVVSRYDIAEARWTNLVLPDEGSVQNSGVECSIGKVAAVNLPNDRILVAVQRMPNLVLMDETGFELIPARDPQGRLLDPVALGPAPSGFGESRVLLVSSTGELVVVHVPERRIEVLDVRLNLGGSGAIATMDPGFVLWGLQSSVFQWHLGHGACETAPISQIQEPGRLARTADGWLSFPAVWRGVRSSPIVHLRVKDRGCAPALP